MPRYGICTGERRNAQIGVLTCQGSIQADYIQATTKLFTTAKRIFPRMWGPLMVTLHGLYL
jgi:hypothetical protein